MVGVVEVVKVRLRVSAWFGAQCAVPGASWGGFHLDGHPGAEDRHEKRGPALGPVLGRSAADRVALDEGDISGADQGRTLAVPLKYS
jgi:hypothetical protein